MPYIAIYAGCGEIKVKSAGLVQKYVNRIVVLHIDTKVCDGVLIKPVMKARNFLWQSKIKMRVLFPSNSCVAPFAAEVP